MVTNNNGSYDITFDDKTYMVSADMKQEGERTVIVSVIDGVKTSASVVVMGQSVHLFTAVSINIAVMILSFWTDRPWHISVEPDQTAPQGTD